MSTSYYRGQLYTNKKLKGPFTEAKDDFTEAYDILQKEVGRDRSAKVKSLVLGDKLMFSVEGMFVVISRDGKVEIGEGAA